MTAQTADRNEMHQIVDILSDSAFEKLASYAEFLRLNENYSDSLYPGDPILTGTSNAETLEALREVRENRLMSFGSTEELFKFLDS